MKRDGISSGRVRVASRRSQSASSRFVGVRVELCFLALFPAGVRLEHPERSQNQKDRGHGYDLVNDIFGGARALRTVAGGRQGMRYALHRRLHLAPSFPFACAALYQGKNLVSIVTATVRSLRNMTRRWFRPVTNLDAQLLPRMQGYCKNPWHLQQS